MKVQKTLFNMLIIFSVLFYTFQHEINFLNNSENSESIDIEPFPEFDGFIKFNIRNSCQKSIGIFLDPFKPPCDKEGKLIPFGECSGGVKDGLGWNDNRNGNISQQMLLNPGKIWSIPILKNDSNQPEWCFDEGGKRTCSGNGGWIGIDCEERIGEGLKCKSGQENGFPWWPNRFEPNFNNLNDVVFYNLSGVDGLNVNMKMFSTGTCSEFDKKTECNLDLKSCPYPDKLNRSCPSQCQACNRIASGDYPKEWDILDFIDPSTGNFVNCKLLCAAEPGHCEDRYHEECAQRVEGKNSECCKLGICKTQNCEFEPVKASKKWCDYIHGELGGECDIYCWAYDDAKGTRACGYNGNINLDVTCSFNGNKYGNDYNSLYNQ